MIRRIIAAALVSSAALVAVATPAGAATGVRPAAPCARPGYYCLTNYYADATERVVVGWVNESYCTNHIITTTSGTTSPYAATSFNKCQLA